MSDPLSGFAAANLTIAQLKALTAGTAGSQSAFLAQAAKIAAQHGVTAAEFLNSLRTSTTVAGQVGSLAETALAIAETHGVTAAILETEIAAATAATAAGAGAGGAAGASGAGGAGAAGSGGAGAGAGAAGGAAASGTAMVIGGAIIAGLVGLIGYTGIQSVLADREADAAVSRADATEEMAEIVRDTDDNSVSGPEIGASGYALIQVTNHPNKAVSIRPMSAITGHQNGEAQLRLCNFLHGGRCGGDVVDTPNGPVTIDESPVASFSVLGEFPDYTSASSAMCSQMTNVAANNLSEGFSGDFGGERVTIDAASGGAPC